MNILGDAANEPSIAVDPLNPARMSIGWRQFDSVQSSFRQAGVAYTSDGGWSWTSVGPLELGAFRSDPVLRSDANGTFYYYSLDGDLRCQFFRSFDGGATWQAPIPAAGGDKAWFAVDESGGTSTNNIYAAWRAFAGCCGANSFTRSFDGGETFALPQRPIPPVFWGTLAVGPDGAVFLAGRRSQNNYLMSVLRSDDAQNSQVAVATFSSSDLPALAGTGAAPGVNPAGLAGQVYIQTDRSNGAHRGSVYVLVTVPANDPHWDTVFTRSTDRGATWSPPTRVHQIASGYDESSQWFGMLDVAPNGRIDVLYNDTREDGTAVPAFSRLHYAASFDGGETWRYDIPVSPAFNHTLGYPMQQKLGDYYDLRSDETGVNVAYAATFNGEQDIYFLRVEFFDQNQNGVLDVDEIDAGQLADCNDNDFPDAYEVATGYARDCDKNGALDDCEIASGTVGDCNLNGVPDECDLANGAANDCDGDGILDECQIAADANLDCDGNGVLDACDIAAGAADCNGNGRPDSCDVQTRFVVDSGPLSPIGAGNPQSFLVPNAPRAAGDVTVTFRARADVAAGIGERLIVRLGNEIVGVGFDDARDCSTPASETEFAVAAASYNASIDAGATRLDVSAQGGVNAELCDPPSFVQLIVSYVPDVPFGEDFNLNGVPDDCEFPPGDVNCDGEVTLSDIAPFVLALTDAAEYADQFPGCDRGRADLTDEGTVTVSDIAPFVELLAGE